MNDFKETTHFGGKINEQFKIEEMPFIDENSLFN